MSRQRAADLLTFIYLEGVELQKTRGAGVQVQRLVLSCLAAHVTAKGEAWPSQEYMAEKLQLSRKSVRDALKALEVQGMIERHTPPRKGYSPRWRVLPTQCTEHGGTPRHLDTNETPQHGGKHGGKHGGTPHHEDEEKDEVPPTHLAAELDSPEAASTVGPRAAEVTKRALDIDLANTRNVYSPEGLRRKLRPIYEPIVARLIYQHPNLTDEELARRAFDERNGRDIPTGPSIEERWEARERRQRETAKAEAQEEPARPETIEAAFLAMSAAFGRGAHQTKSTA
ncbi:MAG: Helix-turn-helix domain [Actinomycetota bacterium]|jgi:hypothetical protein